MESRDQHPRRSARATGDLVLAVLAAAAVITAGQVSGVFEWIHHGLHAAWHHEVDALLPAIVTIQLVVIWYARRRHADFRNEVIRRQSTADKLRVTTERYAQLIETLREEYFFYRHDANGVFEYVSPSVEHILGHSPDELKRHYATLLTDHPVNQEVARYTELGLQGHQQPPYRVQAFHKNGERRNFVVTEIPAMDPAGKVVALEGIARDVTTQLRLEDELRRSEAKFRSLVTNIPGMVYRALPDWTTEIVSGSEEIIGYSAADLGSQGGKWLELILPSDSEDVLLCSQSLLRGPCSIVQSYRIVAKDGTVRWMEDHKTSLFSPDGDFQGVDGIVFDITDRKEAEQAIITMNAELEERVRERTAKLEASNEELRQKNAELDEFTYVASHDLQEPLRKITAFGGLLRKDIGTALPERAESDLAYVIDGARRMQELIDHLLLLSRAGRTALRRQNVSLRGCAEKAIDTLRLRVAEQGAVVAFEDLPSVTADETMLVQLYQNLLENALKYIAGRRPEIRLTAEMVEGEHVFGVRDNGIGIAAEYADQIFAPFKRLHGRSEYPGTGIGLSICRKIVERHGGKIWVESEPGHGSHFRFTLAGSVTFAPEKAYAYATR